MSWRDKITVNDLLEFCKVERTRTEIADKFKMSNIESHHCMKWMVKTLSDQLIIRKRQGFTKRGYTFQTRIFTNDEIKLLAEMRKNDF